MPTTRSTTRGTACRTRSGNQRMTQLIAIAAAVAVLVVVAFGCNRRRAGDEHSVPPLNPSATDFGISIEPIRRCAAQVAARDDDVIRAESRRIAPVVSEALRQVGRGLRPGMTTRAVHDEVVTLLRRAGLEPAMAGYNGYPAGAAVSINDEILHAIPSDRQLRTGDLVTIETGGVSERAYASQGWTFAVGEVDEERHKLLVAARRALERAIGVVRRGARIGDLGAAIQEEIESAGFAVVRDYVGYGMGRERIQPPQLPCYGRAGTGRRLVPGQVLHIHVIAKAGGWQVSLEDDEWTTRSADGRPGVLLTAMVLVEEDGAVLLSRLIDRPGGAGEDRQGRE